MPCPSYLIDYWVNACNDYILHPEKYI
jgi:hypothetical protein